MTDFEYDSSSDYESEEQREEFRRYRKQIEESEGYDVDFVPDGSFFGGVHPLDLTRDDVFTIQWAKESADIAIDDYNQNHEVEEKLKLVEIEKANLTGSGTFIYLITLQAQLSASQEIKTYQTEVYYDPYGGEHEVHLFRIKQLHH